MAWRVGVEVPEELAEGKLRVLQADGEELEEDHLHNLRWPLTDPLGSVVARWSDEAGAGVEREFGVAKYRIFKIARLGDNGRAVSRVTRGHYIVIAPKAFARSATVGAPPPVAPETVMPEAAGLVAHHVLAGAESDKLVLSDGAGPMVEIRSSIAPAYELVGHRIEDAHRAAGPLFGCQPPRLRIDGAEEPALVVAGIEGPSPRRRLRQAASSFGEVQAWFDQHEPGWFFVRLYNMEGDLIDSLDFRYAKALEAIEIDEHPPLPPSEGHRSATVRFRLASDLQISPVEGAKGFASLRSLPPSGLTLPARPDTGQATLRLGAEKGGEVEVVVAVPRVWWAFTSEGEPRDPPRWADRSQRLTSEDLQPTSARRLSVLLPSSGWADALFVGFRDGSPRPVQVLRSERRVDYPLRGLGEDLTLRLEGRHELVVSVQTRGALLGPVTVGEVRLHRDKSRQQEKDWSLDLSRLSVPRLMGVISRGAWFVSAAARRAVRLLRTVYYERARKGDPLEMREFLLQGLALVAALLRCGGARRLRSRWRRRAELLAEREPGAVAEWQLRLRQAETTRQTPGRRSFEDQRRQG